LTRPFLAAGAAPRPNAPFLVLPVVALLLWAGSALAREAPASFADLAEKLLPAVVNIATSQTIADDNAGDQELQDFFKNFFERQGREAPPRRATSLGSGFIIDAAGYIVTNNHVIADADEIKVRLHDEREFTAKIIGRDLKTDLALLKVETNEPLPALEWGDSDVTRIGDWVLAIGNPFGLGGSVTAGIVSARQRDINSGPYDEFLQTDAAINSGNSGGPMFSMDGQVIGINTAIISPSGGSIGIGFAVPSSIARNVIQQLRDFGRMRRGWLGVRIQTLTDELAEGLGRKDANGALVAEVTGGGPADKAGIEQGDVILSFAGQPIDEMRRLPRVVAETPIGKTVDVVLWRKGKEKTVQAVVGELEEEEAAAAEAPGTGDVPKPGSGRVELLGLTVAGIDDAMREKLGIEADAEGVVVVEVDPSGPAAEKGMTPGDVIVEVDQQAVASPDDVMAQVKKAKAADHRVVTILVYRQGDYEWVALRLAQN
jgi:serine protease Do